MFGDDNLNNSIYYYIFIKIIFRWYFVTFKSDIELNSLYHKAELTQLALIKLCLLIFFFY